MSDDDLWRGQDTTAEPGSSGEHPPAGDQPSSAPSPQVSDETQPLHGTTPTPPAPASSEPPAPPAPPSTPPSAPPPTQGAVPPPHNPYGQSSAYGAPPPQNPYGQNPYGAPGQPFTPPPNPYPAPNEYGAPQSPYGVPYQPSYAGGGLPDHPSATTAMVLGIVGLVGILLCGGITLVLSPAAWVVGRKAVREIDASPGRFGGRDRAQAGKIMGIIGTVLLVLGVLLFVAVVALLVTSGTSSPQPAPQHGFLNG